MNIRKTLVFKKDKFQINNLRFDCIDFAPTRHFSQMLKTKHQRFIAHNK